MRAYSACTEAYLRWVQEHRQSATHETSVNRVVAVGIAMRNAATFEWERQIYARSEGHFNSGIPNKALFLKASIEII